jgi:hypothetical protein
MWMVGTCVQSAPFFRAAGIMGPGFRGDDGNDESARIRAWITGWNRWNRPFFTRNFHSPWFQPTGTAALAEGCPMG